MLLSKLLGERFKEKPADATLASHIFLLRGGYVRQVANGIYSMLLPAKRVAAKIEAIIREEMDNIGGQEVLFPVVMPYELWKESGRYDSVGSELVRFRDRTGHDMLLGMTHEEAAVHLARTEARSWAKYPFMIYQIQTKFRDEPRSRGGLIRVREFTMKDAYSFHTSQEDLERYYDIVLEAYHRIFRRVGLPQVVAVSSDSGMMGGKVSHEFMLLTDGGEDTIVVCENCDYRANAEVAVSRISHAPAEVQPPEEVYTPGIKDIDSLAAFFDTTPDRLMKAAVFAVQGSKKPLVVFIRGDLQVNEAKLRNIVGAEVFPLTDHEGADLCFGYIGAVGLDSAKADILYDASLEGETCLIGGANKPDHHIKGISVPRDVRPDRFVDVARVSDGDVCTKCGGRLALKRGIEVGNIFQLGARYTETMDMTFTDSDGKQKYPVMGCYGIGVGRLIASIIEASHDDYGPIWPMAVAPWHIHICVLNSSNEDVRKVGYGLYEELGRRYEVLLDDRNVTAGVMFADADLLGVPVRVIVSARNIGNGEAEITTRDKKIRKTVKLDEIRKVIDEITALYAAQ
ncbi:MAG TPA: proline--tRNA ligase [Clostridiales bacterium]|nr:proline--tRNA ligase [Clostridiales bacterium]HPV01665.1 proline--tRNA ligase [Clostridiales bacterium]